MTLKISQMTAARPLTGTELVEVSQLSSTVSRTATTISALASDNSINDSASGFITAGFAVGDQVRVQGFTGSAVNNLMSAQITALTADKMTFGGTDGDALVDDAAGESVTVTRWDSRQVATQAVSALAGANYLINGGFDLWQLATSQTSNGFGSADRWFMANTGTTKTASRQAFTLGQVEVAGEPTFYCRTVVATVAGAANLCSMIQAIEGVRRLAGKTVTLSFWARADASRSIAVEGTQFFGTGGSPSAEVTGIGAQRVALTTTWARYTCVLTFPSISGRTLGSNANTSSSTIRFWFDAGSSFNARTDTLGQQSGTFEIANVQIEDGATASSFEILPIEAIERQCRRYLQVRSVWVGVTGARTVFPINMRGVPAITGGGTGFTSTGTTADMLVSFQTTAAQQTLTFDAQI